MPEGFGQFIPPEARGEQYKAANFVIDRESETELLTPPSVDRDTILNMSAEEVKTQFPKRYEMYIKVVRELKHPESENHPVNLTPEDIEDMKKWLLALNSVDNYIARHRSPKEGDEIVLRGEKQVDVFDDIRKFLERNGKEGYLKLPTGFGKTVLFTELVEATNLRALIAVPTKLLITQTEKKFQQFAPGVSVGKVYGEEEKVYDKQATLITYDSLLLGLKDGTIDPNDYDLLILDEAHGILSEARSEAVTQFPDAVKLGFTATPVYKPGEKEVSNVLGTEIHSIKIREAVEGGYLSSFTSIAARTQVDISSVKVNAEGDYSQEDLEKVVNIKSRNQAAVDLYKQGFEGRLAVAYCVGVQHAKDVADLFNENGVTAVAIHGKTSADEQEKILADYKSGKIKVLCNADLLIAGFDEQQASVCFNLRPTKSLVVAEQRGGRVLRIDENNPNKHAYIVDFIDQGTEKSGQVLFPQVAEAVELEEKEKKKREGGGGGGKVDLSHINVEGLDLVIDQEVMLEIVQKIRKQTQGDILKAETKIHTYAELKIALQKYIIENGIKVNPSDLENEYIAIQKKNPHFPKSRRIFYMDGFVSLYDLFETERFNYDRLKSTIQNIIKDNNISVDPWDLMESYRKIQKDHTYLPAMTTVQRMEDFISLADLMDAKIIRDQDELKMAVKNYIAKSGYVVDPKDMVKSYTEMQIHNKLWPPVSGVRLLPGFNGLEYILSIEKPRSPKRLREIITNLIQSGKLQINPRRSSIRNYEEAFKLDSTLPSRKTVVRMMKKDEKLSFEYLLGFTEELYNDAELIKEEE